MKHFFLISYFHSVFKFRNKTNGTNLPNVLNVLILFIVFINETCKRWRTHGLKYHRRCCDVYVCVYCYRIRGTLTVPFPDYTTFIPRKTAMKTCVPPD